MNTVYREITPLSSDDCFTVFSRVKPEFDFPLHSHDEFELNFIRNAAGAKRIVGFHIGEITDIELVLAGGNIPHGWFTHRCTSRNIHEITIQFHKDLFDEKLLSRNQMGSIRSLLARSGQGILFSADTALKIASRLESIAESKGFESFLELLSILHTLAVSSDIHILSTASAEGGATDLKSRRLEKAFEHMRKNYENEITLKDISELVNMPEVSFSRFFRKRTGRTFVDSLNEIRISHASRLLITTTQTVAEISYKCGFNNLSYFNRIFKRKNGCTPGEFRENYADSKIFI